MAVSGAAAAVREAIWTQVVQDAALHMAALMTKAAMTVMPRLDDGSDDDVDSTRSTNSSLLMLLLLLPVRNDCWCIYPHEARSSAICFQIVSLWFAEKRSHTRGFQPNARYARSLVYSLASISIRISTRFIILVLDAYNPLNNSMLLTRLLVDAIGGGANVGI